MSTLKAPFAPSHREDAMQIHRAFKGYKKDSSQLISL